MLMLGTYKVPPIPTPPATVNAPVVVETASTVFDINNALVVELPLLVTLCKVDILLMNIVEVPEAVLT